MDFVFPQEAGGAGTEGSAVERGVLFALRDVRHEFGGKGGVAIKSLDIRVGVATAIIGPSGCGKSTLLSLLGGMSSPTEAETLTCHLPENHRAELKEHPPSSAKARFAFVFQDSYVIREATCRDNIAQSLASIGRPANLSSIDYIWGRLGIAESKLDEPAYTMSGGMRQRVALARALVRDPVVILADEPTANLDPNTAREVMRHLKAWVEADDGRSLVFITHDPYLALDFADDIVALSQPEVDDGPGELMAGPWPRPNPGDLDTILTWMGGMNAGTAVEPTVAQSSAIPRYATRSRWALVPNIGIFARIGWSMNFAPSSETQVQRWRNYFRSADFYVALSILATGAAITAELNANRHVVPSQWLYVGTAVLLLLATFLPRLTPRKFSTAAQLRFVGWLILTLTALIASVGSQLIRDAAAYRLADPNLQPLIIRPGGQPATERFVWALQRAMSGEGSVAPFLREEDVAVPGIVRPATTIEYRAVQGRYASKTPVPVFIPAETNVDPPRCAAGPEQPPLANVLAVSDLETFPGRHGWWDIGEHGPKTIAELTPETVRSSGATPSRGGEWDSTRQAWVGLEAHISQAFLERDLHLARSAQIPEWICLSPGGDGSFEPLRITAVFQRPPTFDVATFHVVVGLPVGAAMASGAGKESPATVPYDLISVNMFDDKQRVLDYLKRLDDRHVIRLEVGADRLRQAVEASKVPETLAVGLSFVIAILSGFVTLLFVTQMIAAHRRELALARAFGAGRLQVLTLVFVQLGTGLLLAMAVSLGLAALTYEATLDNIARVFEFDLSQRNRGLIPVIEVLALGFLIVFAVSVAAVSTWWANTKSLAGELKEVG